MLQYRFLAVALLICGYALAQDEPLVRCNRELCSLHCTYGQKTDSHGCFTCECLEDPCNARPCARGMQCTNTVKCASNKNCIALEYTCTAWADSYPCAMPMCSDFCPHGFVNNEHGCMTCNCAEDSCLQHKCPDGHVCKEEAFPGHGPGGVTEYEPFCVPVPGLQPQLPTAQNIKNSMSELTVLPPLCSLRKMALEDPNVILPYHLTDFQKVDRKPEDVKCLNDGHDFEPLQCNPVQKKCWCETDAGEVVNGSVNDSSTTFTCVPHETNQVVIQLVLMHDMLNIAEPEDLAVAVKLQVSIWTNVGLEYIEINELIPTNAQVVLVTFTITSSEHVMYIGESLRWKLMRGGLQVNFKDSQLTPDSKKMSIKPVSKPISSGGLREEPKRECSAAKIWREHKPLVIGFAVLGLFIILGVILMIKLCRVASAKRQYLHQRMSHYSENLSINTDIYSKVPDNDKPQLVIVEGVESKEVEA